jgi:hypothetical protein
MTKHPNHLTFCDNFNLYECLAAARMLPRCQEGSWSNFEGIDSTSILLQLSEHLYKPVGRIALGNGSDDVWIALFVDGPDDGSDLEAASLLDAHVGNLGVENRNMPGRVMFEIPRRDDAARSSVIAAREAVMKVLEERGLTCNWDRWPD